MALGAELLLDLVGEFHVARSLGEAHRLEIEHAATAYAALDQAGRQAEIFLPIRGQQHAGEMPAGGMTADVEPLGVAAEALGIAVDPSDGAAHLLGHDHQIAAGFQHIVEVEYDVMRARIYEHLGRIFVVQSEARAPGAAMNENAHGSVRDSGGEHVERLDRRWPVGETLRRAEPFAGEFTVAGATLEDVVAIGGVDE